jgi:hypothetical protein
VEELAEDDADTDGGNADADGGKAGADQLGGFNRFHCMNSFVERVSEG